MSKFNKKIKKYMSNKIIAIPEKKILSGNYSINNTIESKTSSFSENLNTFKENTSIINNDIINNTHSQNSQKKEWYSFKNFNFREEWQKLHPFFRNLIFYLILISFLLILLNLCQAYMFVKVEIMINNMNEQIHILQHDIHVMQSKIRELSLDYKKTYVPLLKKFADTNARQDEALNYLST